jgi:hypothetical protein
VDLEAILATFRGHLRLLIHDRVLGGRLGDGIENTNPQASNSWCAPIVRYPSPPLQSSGMSRLRGKSREIFDVKELIGKILRIKDLAFTPTVLWGHARRISMTYSVGEALGHSSQVRCDG